MNVAWWWSWLLTLVGVAGFILAGRKVWWAWYVNLACQGLWVTYALVTDQPGFIAASAIYTVVFTRNAVAWTREHRAEHRAYGTPPDERTRRGHTR